jgi:hypothetical protein
MSYYLFDTRVIAQSEGVQTMLGTVQKHPANPLFGEDQPWEVRFDNLYPNVLYDDDGLFKCWYSPFTIDHATTGTSLAQRQPGSYGARLREARERHGAAAREMGVCYATSLDGITWTKPALDIVEFGGSRANNLVMRDAHGNGIFKDLHAADPAERYKMVLYHEETRRMMVAWSPDGLHWSPPLHCPEIEFPRRDNPANPIVWMGDTHNNALWAPTLESYVLITRMWRQEPRRRLVGRAESIDFRQWSASQPIFEGYDADDQIYAMPIFAYSNLYVGLPMIFHAGPDTVDCELAWSPDTIHWHRLCAGTPLIPRGPAGSYDSGCIYAAATPVLLGDEIRLYYGGNNDRHTDWRDGYFCLATLPRERFAGLATTTTTATGVITTQPLLCTGSQLFINADASQGQVRVAVVDHPALQMDGCQPLVGDLLHGEVIWQNQQNLAPLIGQPVRLRFELQSATLFAFTFHKALYIS